MSVKQRHRRGPETERLLLRELTVDDGEAFFALNSQPEVMRYTGEELLPNLPAARDALANYPDFDRYGYGRWGCELKATGQVIGFCGLKFLPELGETDLGFRLLPAHWGQGLATEAGRACLGFGFDTLRLDHIIAFVLPANAPSIRVIEKLGMRFDGEVEYESLLARRYVLEAGQTCR